MKRFVKWLVLPAVVVGALMLGQVNTAQAGPWGISIGIGHGGWYGGHHGWYGGHHGGWYGGHGHYGHGWYGGHHGWYGGHGYGHHGYYHH